MALHATCFDASALVKLYVDEDGHQVLREHWRRQATRYTTPFCLYETLSALKRHWLRGRLTKEGYLKSATDLVSWFRASDSLTEAIEISTLRIGRSSRRQRSSRRATTSTCPMRFSC
jgi:predicted nucleic acid-binding protein